MRTRQTLARVSRGRAALSLVLALSVLAGACGSDDDEVESGSTLATESSAATSATEGSTAATSASPDASNDTSSASTAPSSAVSTEPEASEGNMGGTLNLLTPSDNPSLDPATFFTAGAPNYTDQAFPIFDALLLQDPGGPGLRYRIAESLESSDSLVWTLKLKPNVMFSDGTPLDAEAVRYNWARLADPELKSPQLTNAQSIESMQVVDSTTLEVTLAAPNAHFPALVAASFPFIGSPTALEADPEGFATNPVGAGAYVLSERVPGDHWTLDRNPNYYGETYLDQIIVTLIPDQSQLIDTISTGGGDMGLVTNASLLPRAREAGLDVNSVPSGGGRTIVFNADKAPFDDVRARQAVTMALDNEGLSEAVYNGEAAPVTSFFTESSPYFDPELHQLAPDPEEAQRLFDELAAEGKPVEFTLWSAGTGYADVQFIQATLLNYDNVSVEIDGGASLADTDVIPLIVDRSFQALYLARFVGPAPTRDLIFGYRTGAPQNFAAYSNPVVDDALAEAQVTQDVAAQKELFDIIQQEVYRDVPEALTVQGPLSRVWDPERVEGPGLTDVAYGNTPDITRIWLTK